MTIPNNATPARLARLRHATLGDKLVECRCRYAEVAGRIFAAQSSRPGVQGSLLGHVHNIMLKVHFFLPIFWEPLPKFWAILPNFLVLTHRHIARHLSSLGNGSTRGSLAESPGEVERLFRARGF